MSQLRTVVIDDSIVYRSQLIDTLSTFPEVRVVGFASDGRSGLEKVRQYLPDLITLDIEMPVMNGIDALVAIKKEFPATAIIMVSSLTRDGSRETIRALELGALDFVTKPDLTSKEANKAALLEQLSRIVAGLVNLRTASPAVKAPPVVKSTVPAPSGAPKIIGIGVSTGGPKALATLIPQLPATIKVPIVMVQHMPPLFTASLAESLARKSALKVVEAHHGQQLEAGVVYIAPGGHQMSIQISSDGMHKAIRLADDPAEHFCKPAVDYLFRSLAKEYRGSAIGIILTGMGKDGTLGLSLMKKFGARTIAQNEETCTVYGMPREAIQAGIVDCVLPIDSMAQEIVRMLG
jgi:two-component system chemotaxis response regulator CheB